MSRTVVLAVGMISVGRVDRLGDDVEPSDPASIVGRPDPSPWQHGLDEAMPRLDG